MKKTKEIYLCENCGNEFPVWSGKCPSCGEWNTLKEFKVENRRSKARTESRSEIKKIDEVEVRDSGRVSSKISELDRVLGGGIVPGSIILLGGEPGIGKSTLLLQVAGNLSKTLYLSAEESAPQVKMRAERLGIKNKEIWLASDGDISELAHEIEKNKPELLIVDSIQTVYLPDYDATPGSLLQVRECGIFLQQLAKKSGIPIILIGHVTKEGNLAGPRILEHLVDVVLYLEGERFNDARILRGVKNRFGATNEVGIFSLQEKGLVEIKNPSELFISEYSMKQGSAVTVTFEGTRPLLVEIQALAMPTHFGYPKRTSSGFDLNRLNLLAAVISKKTNVNLNNYDIYLNVAGGIKLSEPAVDLAICAAIVSSYKDKPYKENYCFFGEVGLLGEIRNITRQDQRSKEAEVYGFKRTKIKNLTELFLLMD